MRSRGRECKIDPRKLKAVVRRLDEQLEKSRENARQLQDRDHQYDELRSVLEDLPQKLAHPVMVPFGPLAFFEGHLEHTNEVLVQCSSEWFAMKTAKHALGTVDRRTQRLHRDIDDVAREVKEIETKRRLTVAEAAACGIQLGGLAAPDCEGILDIREPYVEHTERARESGVAGATVSPDADGYLDIREPCAEEAEMALECDVPGATVTRDADGYLDISEPASLEEDAIFTKAARQPVASVSASSHAGPGPDYDRLRELMRLEEMEGEGAKDGQDELDELDDLCDSYERTGMPPSFPGADGKAAGSHLAEAAQSASVRRSGAEADIRSPSDIYRLMSSADQSAAALGSSSPAPAIASSTTASALPCPTASRPAAEHDKAWSGQIRENPVSLPAGAQAAGGGTAAAPRLSKFKADRQKLGR